MNTTLRPGEHARTLPVDGRLRRYLVHVPASYQAHRPTPVVLALHGATANSRLMRSFSGLSEKAEAAGFLAVYPDGTGHSANVLTWNAGNCCGYAQKNNLDDVAFVRALLDDLESVIAIDRRRVFAAGISNGAMMAYRLASECADRIAAIAAVAGPMACAGPSSGRAVPVLHIHGSDDEFAPYLGGRGPRSAFGLDFRSAAETVAAWVGFNGCVETPTVVIDPPQVDDGTRIVRRVHGGGRDDSVVVFITVEGGGHTWPGRPPFPATLGKSTANLNANDTIWDFFEHHHAPGESGTQGGR